MTDDVFAPAPFRADDAHAALRRQLRELRLTEREGRFEWRGQPVAILALDPPAIVARTVKAPGRSPSWTERRLGNAAEVRDWLAQLKASLARWSTDDD